MAVLGLHCCPQSSSSCSKQGLLSNCGAQAQVLLGMWDLPRPVIEPVSPTWAGRFLNH